MLDSLPITLDGLTFAWGGITELLDSEDNSLIVTSVDGWMGAPARRTAHTERPGADGAFRGDAFRGTRGVTIEGRYYAQDVTRLRLLERRLASLCADPRRLYPLTVQDHSGPLTAYVELSGEIKVAPVKPWYGEFSISLLAPDPRRFGTWMSGSVGVPDAGSGGVIATGSGAIATGSGLAAGISPTPTAVTLTDPGTTGSLLVAQFTGPATNPSITKGSDGTQVTLRGNLGAGESIWINLAPQQAHEVPGMPTDTFLHGRSVFGPGGYAGGGGLTVVNGAWPAIRPGETANFLFLGGGPGSLHLRPSYW